MFNEGHDSTGSDTKAHAYASHRGTRLPGDAVAQKTEHLPDDVRSAIRWLHAHGDERGLTNKALGDLIGYSEATISRLFNANYDSDYGLIVDKIERVREAVLAERNSGKNGLPFIECRLSKHIWNIADAAKEFRRIAFMFGETQIGKSRTLKELAARRAGEVTYWEMPTGGSLSGFTTNGAKAMRFSHRGDRAILRRRLLDSFDGNSIVIIDQMHRVFTDENGGIADTLNRHQLDTLDYIIELFDAHEPGIVLCGSNIFREGMSQIASKKFFRQLVGRSLNPEGFQLPDLPARADLNAFARHYKLDPATGTAFELQKTIIETYGLAVWLTRLASGNKRAAKQQRAMTWDDVVRAHDAFTKIGRNAGIDDTAN